MKVLIDLPYQIVVMQRNIWSARNCNRSTNTGGFWKGSTSESNKRAASKRPQRSLWRNTPWAHCCIDTIRLTIRSCASGCWEMLMSSTVDDYTTNLCLPIRPVLYLREVRYIEVQSTIISDRGFLKEIIILRHTHSQFNQLKGREVIWQLWHVHNHDIILIASSILCNRQYWNKY